ncbi:hypothetical protein PRIPAC_96067 [Pristionchus pacificus]|uniref:G protein-coupled receptor n=1 Tax=Pristionchus pacificus TaxID=54126 RepID=A0A2A6D350_PRIPA|nr:hypothetical protein PRIPAC_96067 [Pristionchus pacificus]|eukprot:PDM84713.1 G protein-coupled receptor [Pristionchus pacificus]
MPFRFVYPEPDSLTVFGPTNTTYWLMLLVRTEAISTYKTVYNLAVATEVFALVFGIILHIRGFVLFWKLRVLHINFLMIAAEIYASLVIGMIARLLMIPYEMRIAIRKYLPSIKQIAILGLFEAPIPFLAMVRQGTYAHIYYVLCVCTVERTCATLLVADYEKNTRMHISIILNVFVTIVSHSTGYLVVTGVLNAFAVTALAMLANLGCAMWFRWLIVCNERRLARLTDNLKRNYDEYSLSLRVQLKENVWSMKKIELGIYMLAGGIGANMVLVFAPIYVLTSPAQFEQLQWFVCAANLAYALSLLLTAPWLEVAIAIHTGRVPRILRALLDEMYRVTTRVRPRTNFVAKKSFFKKMSVRCSNIDSHFKQLDNQWTQVFTTRKVLRFGK